MTSNSRADTPYRWTGMAAVLLGSVLLASPGFAQSVASDAPAATASAAKEQRAAAADKAQPTAAGKLQIRDAEARRVAPSFVAESKLMSTEKLGRIKEPLIISIEMATPLSVKDLAGSRVPAIVVDGETVAEAHVAGTDLNRLEAVVDGAGDKASLQLQVGFMGALTETVSEPIVVPVAPR